MTTADQSVGKYGEPSKLRKAVVVLFAGIACVAETPPPPALSPPPDVVISGITTDCITRYRILVRGVNVIAFDPQRHPAILNLLRAMDSVDVNEDGAWPKMEAMYAQALKFVDTATALSRDTSKTDGRFSVTSPRRDSILVIAYAENNQDDFYMRWKLVGGGTGTDITLDMGGCNLPPDAPLFVPPPDTAPVLAVGLTCAPDTLRRGDTLSLVMPVPHGQFLAIEQPGGTWFYLIHPPGYSSPDYSAIPSDSFRAMASYRVPGDVRALPRVHGRDTLEAVFTEPGTYTVIMGEQLGTDYGPPTADCKIVFR